MNEQDNKKPEAAPLIAADEKLTKALNRLTGELGYQRLRMRRIEGSLGINTPSILDNPMLGGVGDEDSVKGVYKRWTSKSARTQRRLGYAAEALGPLAGPLLGLGTLAHDVIGRASDSVKNVAPKATEDMSALLKKEIGPAATITDSTFKDEVKKAAETVAETVAEKVDDAITKKAVPLAERRIKENDQRMAKQANRGAFDVLTGSGGYLSTKQIQRLQAKVPDTLQGIFGKSGFNELAISSILGKKPKKELFDQIQGMRNLPTARERGMEADRIVAAIKELTAETKNKKKEPKPKLVLPAGLQQSPQKASEILRPHPHADNPVGAPTNITIPNRPPEEENTQGAKDKKKGDDSSLLSKILTALGIGSVAGAAGGVAGGAAKGALGSLAGVLLGKKIMGAAGPVAGAAKTALIRGILPLTAAHLLGQRADSVFMPKQAPINEDELRTDSYNEQRMAAVAKESKNPLKAMMPWSNPQRMLAEGIENLTGTLGLGNVRSFIQRKRIQNETVALDNIERKSTRDGRTLQEQGLMARQFTEDEKKVLLDPDWNKKNEPVTIGGKLMSRYSPDFARARKAAIYQEEQKGKEQKPVGAKANISADEKARITPPPFIQSTEPTPPQRNIPNLYSKDGIFTYKRMKEFFTGGAESKKPEGFMGPPRPLEMVGPPKPMAVPGQTAKESVLSSTGPIGSIAAKHESNGRADNISSGSGDFGGKSYGMFQLASNTGDVGKFIKTAGYEKEFAGLEVGSKEFDAKWKELAKDSKFADAQKAHAMKTHFEPQVAKLKKAGIDLSSKGKAVQEAIMSTANQYGAHSSIIEKALAGKDVAKMSDKEVVNAIQDYKAKNVSSNFKSSSADVQASVAKRIERERADLIKLADGGEVTTPRIEKKETKDVAETRIANKSIGTSIESKQAAARGPGPTGDMPSWSGVSREQVKTQSEAVSRREARPIGDSLMKANKELAADKDNYQAAISSQQASNITQIINRQAPAVVQQEPTQQAEEPRAISPLDRYQDRVANFI